MNKRTVLIMLLSAALAAATVGTTGATEQKVPKGKGVTKSVPFSVTGVYTGSLSGEIVVDGQSIFINDKTSLHKVGVGPVEGGETVNNAAIFVGGVMKGKKAIATMIVIGERTSTDDYSETTIAGAERDPATSKDGR